MSTNSRSLANSPPVYGVRGPATINIRQSAGMRLVPASETSCKSKFFCCSMLANFE